MHPLPLLSLLIAANAATLPPWLAGVSRPSCGETYQSIEMVEFNDGPTHSGDAGIGAEFETIDIQFRNAKCDLKDTFSAKRKTFQGRSGVNYVLSVDTAVEIGAGTVNAEYVLDGTNIRVGDGSAAAAGRAIRDSLASVSST